MGKDRIDQIIEICLVSNENTTVGGVDSPEKRAKGMPPCSAGISRETDIEFEIRALYHRNGLR